MRYPDDTAGYKGRRTSRLAAEKITPKRPKLWERVIGALSDGPGTPEVITGRLIASGERALLMSVRPRCSELSQLGKIVPTGRLGKGEGGCAATEYRLANEEELALFHARKAMAEDARREAP